MVGREQNNNGVDKGSGAISGSVSARPTCLRSKGSPGHRRGLMLFNCKFVSQYRLKRWDERVEECVDIPSTPSRLKVSYCKVEGDSLHLPILTELASRCRTREHLPLHEATDVHDRNPVHSSSPDISRFDYSRSCISQRVSNECKRTLYRVTTDSFTTVQKA